MHRIARPVISFLIVTLVVGFFFLQCPSNTHTAESISFRNHVMAVLSKSGCNAGDCHGNAHGKGGFKLSLRGYNPQADFLAITRGLNNRRTNRTEPEKSLLLLKPTIQMAHEGRRRFDTRSPEYQILHSWISTGMPADGKVTPRLTRLTVTPRDTVLLDPKQTFQLKVQATFSNGDSRDITNIAVYEPANQLSEVTANGLVRRLKYGENTIAVRYLDQHNSVKSTFIPARTGYRLIGPKPANNVDQHIFVKLRKLRINPSPVIDDATFIRRLALDLLGILPIAKEARTFVSDNRTDKRSRLTDQFLKRSEYIDFWALKWSDLLCNEEKTLDRKGVQAYHAWIRKSIADDKPLNQYARELIAARGSTYKKPAANFYRTMREPLVREESTAQLFLGICLQCAKCHNHSFDHWTQDDYYGWANNFARIQYGIVENKRKDCNDKHKFAGEQIVFLAKKGDVLNPNHGVPVAPRFLGETVRQPSLKRDRLLQLADWIANPKNTLFAKSQANRIWFQVMGKGIVDPIDDFRATNPPVNSELLDALAKDFAKHNYSIRHLLRTILNSKTYQLEPAPNATNRADETNFSHALIRKLSAEQMLDSLSQTIGTPVEYNGYPLGTRATQFSGVRAFRMRDKQPSLGDKFLKLFGKPLRLQSCECERTEETTLPQTFQMASGPLMNLLLTHPKNRLTQIAKSSQSTANLVDDLYWTALTRPPLTGRIRSLQYSPCQHERSTKGVGRHRLVAGQFFGISTPKITSNNPLYLRRLFVPYGFALNPGSHLPVFYSNNPLMV